MKRKGTFLWRMVVGVIFISSSAFAQGPPSKSTPLGQGKAVPTPQGSDKLLPYMDFLRADGTKVRGRIENNKLLIWQGSGPGSSTVAPDGVYKTGDGKSFVVKGGIIATQGGASGPLDNKAIRIEQLSSKAQFNALADDTLLEIGGRKIRKADFVAEFKRRAVAGPAGAAAVRPSGLAGIQARLTAEEDAAIAASSAEVRRRLAEIRAQGGDR